MESISRSEAVVRKRLAVLSRTLPSATHGDIEALHEARVASRRLREALPVILEAGRRQRKLQKRVRRITRLLGPARELDVALANLDEVASSPGVARTATREVRSFIMAERKALQKALRKEIDAETIAKLRKRALGAVRRSTSPSRRDQAARRTEAWRHAMSRAIGLRAAIQHAATLYLPDRLHEVRLGVKKLRYALETVAELQARGRVIGARALKQAQDLLGRMHDFEMLISRTRAVQSATKVSTLRQSAELDRLVRHLEGECRLMHAQYVGLRTTLTAICDRTERTATKMGIQLKGESRGRRR
jgi:CHAD domain-containing protein